MWEYSYRILLNSTKEWTTDISNNIDESLKHCVEGKKPDTKESCMIPLIWDPGIGKTIFTHPCS